MRAYVDTRTGRLGTLVDRMKARSAIEFAILHRWQWLDPLSPVLRLVVLSCFLLAAFAVTLSGCWIYVARWTMNAARWNLRRVHRVWGISISLVSFMFVLSGSFHLLHLGIRGDSGERYHGPAPEHRAADLKLTIDDAIKQTGFTAVESVSLAQIDGQTYYRVQPALETNPHETNGADHHAAHVPQGKATASQVAAPKPAAFVSTRGESILPDGAKRYAMEVAKSVTASQAAGPVTLITEFDPEYGFAYKRLPVQRILFAHDLRCLSIPLTEPSPQSSTMPTAPKAGSSDTFINSNGGAVHRNGSARRHRHGTRTPSGGCGAARCCSLRAATSCRQTRQQKYTAIMEIIGGIRRGDHYLIADFCAPLVRRISVNALINV